MALRNFLLLLSVLILSNSHVITDSKHEETRISSNVSLSLVRICLQLRIHKILLLDHVNNAFKSEQHMIHRESEQF